MENDAKPKDINTKYLHGSYRKFTNMIAAISVVLVLVLVGCKSDSDSIKTLSTQKPKSRQPQTYATKKPTQSEIDEMVKLQTKTSAVAIPPEKTTTSKPKVEISNDKKPQTTTIPQTNTPAKNPQATKVPEKNVNSDGFKTYEKSFEEKVEYVGNSKTMKFHLKGCSSVEKIAPGNVCILKSLDDARRSGFVSCKKCNP